VLFDDSWSVGLWTFSTKLDNGNDWREVLPIKPMSEQRPKLQQALGSIAPIPNGETGLYDTVLAAYKTVQSGLGSPVGQLGRAAHRRAEPGCQRHLAGRAHRAAQGAGRPETADPGHRDRHR
jgi:hypothetical protein